MIHSRSKTEESSRLGLSCITSCMLKLETSKVLVKNFPTPCVWRCLQPARVLADSRETAAEWQVAEQV